MDFQNLTYASTQVAHNFGAVIVVAAPLHLLFARLGNQRRLLWLVLAGWIVQIASGVLFGAVSFYYYGQLPDIHGLAITALILKLLCAGAAVALIIAAFRSGATWSTLRITWMWRGLAALGIIAITAAAFLRWFS